MSNQSFWKKEIKVTSAFLAVMLIVVFVIAGLASGVFLNYVFPHFTSIPVLRLINPRLPVVVNKTEQVVLNDNVNTRTLYDRLKAVTVTVASYSPGADFVKQLSLTPKVSQGVVVTSDGLIFTTKSAVGNEKNALYVITSAGSVYEAKLLAFDPKSSLAVLKIAATSLPVLSFVPSNQLAVGDKLIAAGGSFEAYNQPAVLTWISQLPSMVSDYSQVYFSEGAGGKFNVVPTLPKEFNGSGLINQDGKLAGFLGDEGILPGEYLQDSLNVYLRQQNLSRAALGVRYLKITETVSSLLKLPATTGALLTSTDTSPAVVPGSAAAVAGLKAGDFIVKIDDQLVDANHPLENTLNKKQPGEILRLEFFRAGQLRTIEVTLKAIF
jgi:serine protease Do